MSMSKCIPVALLCVVLFAGIRTNGQGFNQNPGYWKTQRHAFGFGVGMANFLGELGGQDQVGSDFIHDLEWSETRPALHVNYRYQFASRFYARAQYTFGVVGGNDALTNEIFRRNRNLHFRSSIHELSLQIEANLLDFTRKTRYDKNIKKTALDGWALYGVLGIGITRFNPKANFAGEWYALKPLGTEGQLQEDGPAEYGLFSIVIPLGFGIRYDVNKDWTLGLEISHRITFTDYMDDVSTVYFDNERIRETQGELAAFLADPSLGYYINDAGDQVPLNSTATGEQRGDPEDNDSYFTAMLTATYKITQKRYKQRRGRVTKRRRVSF